MSPATGSSLRAIVLALAAIEGVALLLFAGLMLKSSDQLGKAIGFGMIRLAVVPLLVVIVPALMMGLLNRGLSIALAMLLLAPPAFFVLWRLA